MSELVNKLSSYNIFNYLFPGAVFSILAERLNLIDVPEEIIPQLIWYYFFGMVISRIGSLAMEPILKRSGFVRYGDYDNYLRASEADKKLETMVEVSNTYRTLAAGFAILNLGLICKFAANYLGVPQTWQTNIALLLLLVLFLLAFRKQNGFILKRGAHWSEGEK